MGRVSSANGRGPDEKFIVRLSSDNARIVLGSCSKRSSFGGNKSRIFGSKLELDFRSRRKFWWCWGVTPVAQGILRHVSCVTRIKHECCSSIAFLPSIACSAPSTGQSHGLLRGLYRTFHVDVSWCRVMSLDVMRCHVIWFAFMWCDLVWCEVMRCNGMGCDARWLVVRSYYVMRSGCVKWWLEDDVL